MTDAKGSAADIPAEDADKVEELVQYLAQHDGRLPTDDMPLAWWLVDALELPREHPVRQMLAGVPLAPPVRHLSPKKAHAWSVWLSRREQLVWASRRGVTLDDAVAKDMELRKWVNDNLSRHHIGSLGPVERTLLNRTPLWDFDRELDTRNSRKGTVFRVGLDAVRAFYLEHAHTDIPEGFTVGGIDVAAWWTLTRAHYASGVLKEHHRLRLERLGNLGVDLRTDKELAREQKQKAAEERERLRVEQEREERRQKRAAQRGTDDVGPILDAVRVFAERHGHTGIPVGAVTQDGVEFGRFVDRWRRVRPDRQLRRVLEEIPQWTWTRTPASPTMQRPAPVPVPDDTTQMNRPGLRQFLPGD